MEEPIRDITLHKPRPHILSKQDDRRADERRERAVHGEVDARDQRRCRVCRRRGNPNAIDPLGKIHRAHIRDASRGGSFDSANILSLCWICHSLEHAKQLHIIGTDANETRVRILFDIHEAAVVEVFANRELPSHVRIITGSR